MVILQMGCGLTVSGSNHSENLLVVVVNLTIKVELIASLSNAVQAGMGYGVVLSKKKTANKSGQDESEHYKFCHKCHLLSKHSL